MKIKLASQPPTLHPRHFYLASAVNQLKSNAAFGGQEQPARKRMQIIPKARAKGFMAKG
jgi:hypothetical protein